jgi:hypothetical protein
LFLCFLKFFGENLKCSCFSDFFYLILVEIKMSYYEIVFSMPYLLLFLYNCFYVVFCTCCDFLVFYICLWKYISF